MTAIAATDDFGSGAPASGWGKLGWMALGLIGVALISTITSTSSVDTPADPGDFVSSTQALDITFPRPPGSNGTGYDVGTGLHSNHAVFFAYPSLKYEWFLGAVGGTFPYTWELSNAPAGMSIVEYTADNGNPYYRVEWPNPTTDASNITLTVTDAVNDEDSVTWSIDVNSSRFKFIDCAASGGGDGTFATPWDDFEDVENSGAATDIVYFRGSCTYDMSLMNAENTGVDLRVELNYLDGDPTQFLAYPGDTRPVWDWAYQNDLVVTPRLRLVSQHAVVKGFHIANIAVMGIHFDRRDFYGIHIDNIICDDIGYATGGGANAACLTTIGGDTGSGPWTQGSIIADSEFSNLGNEAVANAIKIYYEQQLLIEANNFHDRDVHIELKENVKNFTVRNNTLIDDCHVLGVNGDLADNGGNNTTRGDIAYNFMTCENTGIEQGAMRLAAGRSGGDGPGPIDSYRNTIIGRIVLENMESTHGPHTFNRNVILNDESGQSPIPYITDLVSIDSSRVTMTENLTAGFGDSRVNASTGELSGGWASYNFLRGHRLQ